MASKRFAVAAAFAALTMLTAPAVAADLVVYENGAAQAPFQLFVGDKKNWALPVGGETRTSAAGAITVVAGKESGNIDASWNGKGGEGQLYLGSAEPFDATGLLENDAALVVLMNVKKAPKKRTTIRMGCGYPCAANAPIMKLLKALPEDQWIRVSFDLKCFADNGLNVAQVDSPFLLTTSGKMSIAIGDVRFVDGAGPGATIKCR